MTVSTILITCAKGIAPFLAREVLSLGLPVVTELQAGIETRGSMDDALRLNLHVRTGQRVLLELARFRAANADELYQAVSRFAWEGVLPAGGYLCVTSSVENDTIRDARFASLRCKDAIVDRIKDRTGSRPDSGPERAHSVVHLYWKGDSGVIYLDTSGEPLSRRGYRKIPLGAPLQETLAAAVVLATEWTGAGNFINPMCGSGTLAIEAALLALGRPPGLLRSNFGFMHRTGFSGREWDLLRSEAKQRGAASFPGRIIASDIDPRAIEAARKNALTAGVEHLIEFLVCSYEETPLPGPGCIVMNPPYGERMGRQAELETLYKGIGDFFKQRCTGYRGFLFTGNPALAKKVSLKPRRSIPLYNSGIECRLLEYELYAGSRKAKKVRAEEGAR